MYSLKYRPPLVVFLLCLLALSAATFYYGYLIDKSGNIVDNDVKYDWLHMLKHFNTLDNCLEVTNIKPETSNVDRSQFSSVRALVSVKNTNYLKQFQRVNGYLSLDGWHPSCPGKAHETPKFLEIEFDLPQIQENDTLIDVCVQLTGYSEYLPAFVQANCEVPSELNKKTKRGTLITKSKRIVKDGFCSLGEQLNMAFDLHREVNISNFLSENARKQIVVRLMWCGSLLIVVKLSILLFVIFYDSLNNSSQEKQFEQDHMSAHLI